MGILTFVVFAFIGIFLFNYYWVWIPLVILFLGMLTGLPEFGLITGGLLFIILWFIQRRKC